MEGARRGRPLGANRIFTIAQTPRDYRSTHKEGQLYSLTWWIRNWIVISGIMWWNCELLIVNVNETDEATPT